MLCAPNTTLKESRDSLFAILLTALYSSLVFLGILRHEMWRDEIQAWLIARDSSSIFNLFQNLQHEGHPALWHLMLYPLTRLTHDPFAMQLLHLLIAATGAYVFLRYSPFSRFHRTLFIFGYFPFFEYGIKSRAYALGALLIFGICALFPHRSRYYSLIGILILVLAQTSIFGLIIGCCFLVVLLTDLPWGIRNQKIRKSAILGYAVGMLGIAAALLFLLWQRLSVPYSEWGRFFQFQYLRDLYCGIERIFFFKFQQILEICFRTELPHLDSILIAIFVLIIILPLIKTPQALIFITLGWSGLLLFFYSIYLGGAWHHGHLYLVLWAGLWLAKAYSPINTPKPFDKIFGAFERSRGAFLTVLLIFQLWGSFQATRKDWRYPYSAAKDAAEFIQANQMEKMLMVGDTDYAASTITGYLNNKIYYPMSDRTGSFIVWDKYRHQLSPDKVIKKAKELGRKSAEDVLLILSYRLEPAPIYLKELKRFDGKVIFSDEKYYLYLLKYTPDLKNGDS